MSQLKTVTINQIRNGLKVQVTIPVAPFSEMYQKASTKLRDMAAVFNITVPGVREAAKKIGLPEKSKYWKFKPKYSDVSLDEQELRRLLVDQNLSYEKTALILGVSSYYVRREVGRMGIETPGRSSHKHNECIPPLSSHRQVCTFLPVCRQLEPVGEPLRCEVLLDDELPQAFFERDSTPSVGGAIPFCNLLR